jgi:hypothetical protein
MLPQSGAPRRLLVPEASGLGVYLMQRHRLARKHLIVVGDIAGNAEFAATLGLRFWDARQFFGWPGT